MYAKTHTETTSNSAVKWVISVQEQLNVSLYFPFLGGLWNYTDSVRDGQACVMKSTVINTSKEMMSYSDFPCPRDFPMFMHNRHVKAYFRLYIERFGLMEHIHLQHEVVSFTSGQLNVDFLAVRAKIRYSTMYL